MIGIRVQCNDKDMREIVSALSFFSERFSGYLMTLMDRFAGKFRQNVYAAVVKNAPWATAGWRPLSTAYIKRKKNNRFYLRTGLLHRSLRPNAKKLRNMGQGGDFIVDLVDGLMVEKIYPKNKRGTTTVDAFMINEFGTKNQRPPSRPVIMPAFWRTLQMFNLEDEFVKIVKRDLPLIFEG